MSSKRQSKQARRARRKLNAKNKQSNRARGASTSGSSSLSWLNSALAEEPGALLLLLEAHASFRAKAFASQESLLPPLAWQAGLAIGASDHALEQLQAPWFRADWGDTENDIWLGHLRAGLDTFARICWCLRFGYTLAGVALTRWFLERWTFNIAFSYEIARIAGEDDAAYMNRVWAIYEPANDPHEAGVYWSGLSELLHGRSVSLSSGDARVQLTLALKDRVGVHQYILEAAELALRQVRVCVSVVAAEAGLAAEIRPFLLAPVNEFPEPPSPPDFLSVFAPPVDLDYVSSKNAHTVTPWGATYRTMIQRGATEAWQPKKLHSWMPIEERWARSADEAREAFDAEAALTGDAYDPEVLRGLLTLYRAITEMTELLAEELNGSQHAAALHTAAAALESAWVLWLQDVDDSMIAMRSVLESTARARAHRLKPERAKTLEARGALTTPHRWLEAAGWSRLAAFARALGEFSHMQERSRHDGSRGLLTEIQRGAISGLEIHTARARALEEVAQMLAHEVATTLDEIDPKLSTQFRSRILLEAEAETEAKLSAWLDHAMKYRSHHFGEANYPMPVPGSPESDRHSS